MPPWDDKRMSWDYRIIVFDRHTKLVLQPNSLDRQLAEHATRLPILIGFDNLAEVGIVSVAFHCVARVTESLEVTFVIGAALVPGHDMINLKGLNFRRDTTELTAELGPLQDFVPLRPRDVTVSQCAVPPYFATTAFFERLQLLLT